MRNRAHLFHLVDFLRAFSLDLDRSDTFRGRRIYWGGHRSPGLLPCDGPCPNHLLIRSHNASTFARRMCPCRRVSPAFRILAKSSSRGERCHAPTGFPLAMPFQTGRFRRLQLKQLSMWRSFLVPRRARPHPKPGGSRQPLDRQVRYYSDWPEEASRLLGDGRCTDGTGWRMRRKQVPEMPKRHSPVGWRLGTCN